MGGNLNTERPIGRSFPDATPPHPNSTTTLLLRASALKTNPAPPHEFLTQRRRVPEERAAMKWATKGQGDFSRARVHISCFAQKKFLI